MNNKGGSRRSASASPRFVTLLRLERRTYCLEGSCSIQLSYRANPPSGHPDSNWGSPAPKAGAITGLRYIPLVSKKGASLGASLWRRRGDSNPRYPNRVRQFSKLLVSATHPPLRVFDLAKKHRFLSLSKSGAKLRTFLILAKYFFTFVHQFQFKHTKQFDIHTIEYKSNI